MGKQKWYVSMQLFVESIIELFVEYRIVRDILRIEEGRNLFRSPDSLCFRQISASIFRYVYVFVIMRHSFQIDVVEFVQGHVFESWRI